MFSKHHCVTALVLSFTKVEYNPEVMKLDITEVNLMLKILVDVDGGKTKDSRYVATEQSVLPVDIKLIPSMNNTAGARSVTVRERVEGTFVTEGNSGEGFDSTYEIYLRPCSDEMLRIIEVSMVATVADQIEISPSVLVRSHFDNDECKATVAVAAIDDDWAEGMYECIIVRLLSSSSSCSSNDIVHQISLKAITT